MKEVTWKLDRGLCAKNREKARLGEGMDRAGTEKSGNVELIKRLKKRQQDWEWKSSKNLVMEALKTRINLYREMEKK